MQRRPLLTTALLATLAATAWVATWPEDGGLHGDAVVAAAPPRATLPRRVAAAASDAAPPRIASRDAAGWGTPPRAALAAWSSPPPAAPSAPASANVRPQPPKFPYAWIGRLEDSGDVQALLSGGERSFGARAGDVLDGRWRVERVAGTRMQLSWLPTGDTVQVDLR